MTVLRWLAPLLIALTMAAAASRAASPDTEWLPFDQLNTYDRSLAEGALVGMFGDDPDLWPDWLDPRAVLIPAVRGGGTLLVVREPYRQPCGQYRFIIFGPPAGDGTRGQLGEGFCAGDLSVVPVSGHALPDLLFAEGRAHRSETDDWERQDQRVRWTGRDWVRIIEK